MKKTAIVLLCIALVVCLFSACKTGGGKGDAPETLFGPDTEESSTATDITENISDTTNETLDRKENTTTVLDTTEGISETEVMTEEPTEESTSDDYDIASAVLDGLAEKYANPVPKNPDGSDCKIPDSLLTTSRSFTTEEMQNFRLSDLDGKSLKEAFDGELIQKMFSTAFIAKGNVEQYYAYIDENTFGIVYKETERHTAKENDAHVRELNSGVGSAAMGIDLAIEGLLMHLDMDKLTVIYEYRDVDNNIMMNFACAESAE